MSDAPQLLLAHHLKALKLPTLLREHDKLARRCAAEGADHAAHLPRLAELELLDRERRMVERRIREARFPAAKSLDSFDFAALPSLNRMPVLDLARGAYVERRENVIALGDSGTGKTHVALGLGLAACQKGFAVGFATAAALVHELLEARDERRLLRLHKQLAGHKLLIVDELGYVPLSTTGAELLFEVFSRRYERGSVLVTSNLPFDEWTSVFGSPNTAGCTSFGSAGRRGDGHGSAPSPVRAAAGGAFASGRPRPGVDRGLSSRWPLPLRPSCSDRFGRASPGGPSPAAGIGADPAALGPPGAGPVEDLQRGDPPWLGPPLPRPRRLARCRRRRRRPACRPMCPG
ncbi:MAG TPA: IS21-like element helper ATPase IstB, partial [Geminicoccaceae bacterium]|nr:IS21-like element helper ATPase IstB [Geminicoccaceae bacterium]